MGGLTLSANVFVPVMLMAVSFAVGVYALLRLVIRTRPKEAEEWRDPPPLIYKLFKPIVRLFSGDVRKYISDAGYARLQSRLSAGGMNYAIMAE